MPRYGRKDFHTFFAVRKYGNMIVEEEKCTDSEKEKTALHARKGWL